MGMKLSEAAKFRAKVEVEFEGTDAKLTVFHNPSAFTPAFEAKLKNELENLDLQGEILCRMLLEMVTEWDLTDDEGFILGADRKGEVIPLTLECLRLVPLTVLAAVSKACQEAHKPSDPNAVAPRRSGSFS